MMFLSIPRKVESVESKLATLFESVLDGKFEGLHHRKLMNHGLAYLWYLNCLENDILYHLYLNYHHHAL